jgi:hypothetical protein
VTLGTCGVYLTKQRTAPKYTACIGTVKQFHTYLYLLPPVHSLPVSHLLRNQVHACDTNLLIGRTNNEPCILSLNYSTSFLESDPIEFMAKGLTQCV